MLRAIDLGCRAKLEIWRGEIWPYFLPQFFKCWILSTRANNYRDITWYYYHMNHQVLHFPIFPTKLAHSANPGSPSSSNCSATCSSRRNPTFNPQKKLRWSWFMSCLLFTGDLVMGQNPGSQMVHIFFAGIAGWLFPLWFWLYNRFWPIHNFYSNGCG